MTRLTGEDRYETSVAIAEDYNSRFSCGDKISIVLTKGKTENYPDALVGDMLGCQSTPMITLLTKDGADSVNSFVRKQKEEIGIRRVYVIGAAAHEANIVSQIENALR